MITYRVDEEGHCQAVQYPTHAHLLQMVESRGLDHILYYPPTDSKGGGFPPSSGCYYVVYLSLHTPIVFLNPFVQGCVSISGVPPPSPTTSELSRVYAWVLQHRRIYAYPYLRISVIRPARNISHATEQTIGKWCDTQIDAFTLFRCKQLLKRDLSHTRNPVNNTTGHRKRPCDNPGSSRNKKRPACTPEQPPPLLL